MKGTSYRSKVVLRHLPPTLPQATLIEQLDSSFSGRYTWFSFRPGRTSQTHQTYSRAYIEFKRSEDVIEFANFFNGHLFVNEKGTQFKTVVEYAPSQRVSKQGAKKDGREGTILKDPEYMEFLDFLARPVENLPSAEIQFERREANRNVAAKDAVVVTPLMEYVRQKRAAKTGVRRAISGGKSTRRVSGSSTRSASSDASKQGSEKRKASKTMYVPRESSKIESRKEKAYIIVTKRDDQKACHKSGSGCADFGKKILLTRGKEKDNPLQNLPSSSAPRLNQLHEAGGRIVRTILVKDSHRNQLSSAVQLEQEIQDREKRPPRPPIVQMVHKNCNELCEDKIPGNTRRSIYTEKPEKHIRSRDRPDRGVWTPLHRSNISQASDGRLSSSTQTARHGSRCGLAHSIKDGNDTFVGEGRALRGGRGYGSCGNGKQMWVQRSSSGS